MTTKHKKEEERFEEVNAYPSIGMLNDIQIEGKETPIKIGGWSFDGFYLEEPYILKEVKNKNFSGNNLTYYSIVKDKILQSEREKQVREIKKKRKEVDIKYFEKSIKESKELIDNYTKKLKELKNTKN